MKKKTKRYLKNILTNFDAVLLYSTITNSIRVAHKINFTSEKDRYGMKNSRMGTTLFKASVSRRKWVEFVTERGVLLVNMSSLGGSCSKWWDLTS